MERGRPNEDILEILRNVNDDHIVHSGRNITNNEPDVTEDNAHLDVLKNIHLLFLTGSNVKLNNKEADSLLAQIEDMMLDILKHENTGIGPMIKRKDLKTLVMDKVDIDEARRQHLKELQEFLRMVKDSDHFDADKARELINKLESQLREKVIDNSLHAGSEAIIHEVEYDQGLIENLRDIAVELPEDNKEQANRRKRDLGMHALKNVMLKIKHDPREHKDVPMEYLLNMKVDRLPVARRKKQELHLLQAVLKSLTGDGDLDNVKIQENIEETIRLLEDDEKSLENELKKPSDRLRAELEIISKEIEHIMQHVDDCLEGKNQDRNMTSVLKELKDVMLRLMGDIRTPDDVIVSELKNADFGARTDLPEEKIAHLKSLQRVLKLLTGAKPKTQKE